MPARVCPRCAQPMRHEPAAAECIADLVRIGAIEAKGAFTP